MKFDFKNLISYLSILLKMVKKFYKVYKQNPTVLALLSRGNCFQICETFFWIFTFIFVSDMYMLFFLT